MNVDIWSDIACPWCYIGKRRFEAALSSFEHAGDVQVRWRSFQLDPSLPPVSGPGDPDHAQRLADKYGMSREKALAMGAQIAAVARDAGLEFDMAAISGGNTFDAHRLLHLAAERGVQDAMKERLFRAYFVEGEPVGDHDALVRLAVEAGLDESEARAVLDSSPEAGPQYAEDVRADLDQAAAYGITGVPFFVINKRYGVSGAQPVETLLAALRQAWQEAALTVVGAGGGSCDGDSCAI